MDNLAEASIFVLTSAALGGAWAGSARRYRMATLLLGLAVVILLFYVWASLVLPEV